jgi:hypothetical protein
MQVGIEIGQLLPALLMVEWIEILGIVIKVWCLTIAGHQGIPMLMAPIAMLGNEYVTHWSTAMGINNRH